jgi:hypothetical protein
VQSQSTANESGQDLAALGPPRLKEAYQGLTTPDPPRPNRTRKKIGKGPAGLSQLSEHDVTLIADESASYPAPDRDSTHVSTWLFGDNPESIFYKPRKAREKTQTRDYIDSIAPDENPDMGTSLLEDNDLDQVFYRYWGYLPPLDEEAVAAINTIITDSDIVDKYIRINPQHTEFPEGLDFRNVSLTESEDPDPYMDCIEQLQYEKSIQETDIEKEAYRRLWTLDRAKYIPKSNEALFQRTLMMCLIARHYLIYSSDQQQYLDFSVEEPWACPPMPTRAYEKRKKFLTQPKPDLAICFDRYAIISDKLWDNIPSKTRRLINYENKSESGRNKAFHFFTIEAKKDTIGKRQNLNNASQALHNMFEFFRDAGHEDIFFSKVRFFSAVASFEGITIRIHRATKVPIDGTGRQLIIPDKPEYPLVFKHRVFCRIEKSNFDREIVLDAMEKIIIGYGVNKLRLLLSNATKSLVDRLEKDPEAMRLREVTDIYRYGQTAC